MRCPHDYKPHCPLYVAMHKAGAPNCWPHDNEIHTGCAVDKGASYDRLLDQLKVDEPLIVAECAVAKRRHEADEQRRRTMRLLGLH